MSEEKVSKSYVEEVMLGLSIIGSRDMQAIPSMILGHYDRQLKCVAYQQHHKAYPTCDEDLETPEAIEGANRVKDFFKHQIQMLFNAAANEEHEEQAMKERVEQRELKRAQEKRMKELHGKSSHGTTAEICAFYNLSKGEVRRMRADGSLDSYLLARNASNTQDAIIEA